MSVENDFDRVLKLVERGTPQQREWLADWRTALAQAVDDDDEESCEDLHDALIVWERTMLRPPSRRIPADEFIRELGFDPAELGVPT